MERVAIKRFSAGKLGKERHIMEGVAGIGGGNGINRTYAAGANRLKDDDEQEAKKKLNSIMQSDDKVEISQKARDLLAQSKESEEEETDKKKTNPDDELTWAIVEAEKDPDDPENRAKARMRMVASGEGRMPGV